MDSLRYKLIIISYNDNYISYIAGLFLLLSAIIFAAMVGRLRDGGSQSVDLGPCFPLSLLAAIVSLTASAMTAWASVRKANNADDDMDEAPMMMKSDQ